MKTREIEVVQFVNVTVDEKQFTPEFMAAFRESFYPFHQVSDHMEHLGQLWVRRMMHFDPITGEPSFIEGYGDKEEIKRLGIRFEEGETEVYSGPDL